MSGRQGVYLVSSKPRGTGDKATYDNPTFDSPGETKVAYSPRNGIDMHEDVQVKVMPDKPYRGMGKEELLHFSSKPFWRRLRMLCMSIVVIGWLALIITVVALVLVYPSCRDPGHRSWWQTEAMYRIYVPSFKDSNDDGVGDLKGIESKLDYIKDLGMGAVSLSPIYSTAASPQFDEGNDMAVTDHMNVATQYGTLADFDTLIEAAHDKGLYVILDFIPNHTSDEHPWYVESSANTTSMKKNYYVWADGVGGAEPNNWKSKYNGAAWTQEASRNQWSLHQFHTGTPDLNLRSAQVQQELESILNFWLERGVDGFNVRDVSYLYEDFDLRGEPKVPGSVSDTYADFEHIYTTNQPEVYSMIARWRHVLRSHNKTSTDKLLMTNIYGDLDTMMLYADCDHDGVQMPLNTKLADDSLPATCDGACIAAYVDSWMNNVPSGKWANWVVGDENTMRLASRYNASFVHAFTMLTMLLPGTPVMYYGDEINMADNAVSSDLWMRAQESRSTMAWDNSTHAGFCNNTCNPVPWISFGDPLAGNVMAGSSMIDIIKELSTLRQEDAFRIGDYARSVRDNEVFSFVREFDGVTGYLVAINFGPNSVTRDFIGSHDTIPSEAVVVMANGGDLAVEDDADPSDITLGPYGGIVVSWDYVAKEL